MMKEEYKIITPTATRDVFGNPVIEGLEDDSYFWCSPEIWNGHEAKFNQHPQFACYKYAERYDGQLLIKCYDKIECEADRQRIINGEPIFAAGVWIHQKKDE
jgi:hypothetical protein